MMSCGGVEQDEVLVTGADLIKPLTPELNRPAQRCLPRFLLRILIFNGLTARRFISRSALKG
jgi:hypothetical protein